LFFLGQLFHDLGLEGLGLGDRVTGLDPGLILDLALALPPRFVAS
jgi:hypothetical protein